MTRVKICGIRSIDDARLAVELGASALGFIFWPSSPRYIEPAAARAIAAAVGPFVTTVGVFVNQPVDFVRDVADRVNLGAIQLHGDEAVEDYADGLRGGLRIIKSVAVSNGGDCVPAMQAVPGGATVLLDAHDPVTRGGTGRTIDWTQASAAARLRPIILSGGLNADNVSEAVAAVRPYAVDVSSGVESSPGVKDSQKLRAFFASLERSS
jgi:phosphoribosylanthranilate isomerase